MNLKSILILTLNLLKNKKVAAVSSGRRRGKRVFYFSISLLFFLFHGLYPESGISNFPPDPEKFPEIKAIKIKKLSLENELKAYVIEDHRHPIVSVMIYFDLPPLPEGELAGLGIVTEKLLRYGTISRTKEVLDEELEEIGSSAEIQSGTIYSISLQKYSEKNLELISDILINPKFTEDNLNKIKKEFLSLLDSEKNDSSAIMQKAVKKLLYGANHSYGEYPTESSIKKITLNDCLYYYRTRFIPNYVHMAFVGDISTDEANNLLNKYFASWKKKEKAIVKFTPAKFPNSTEIYFIDLPSAVQSSISFVNLTNVNYKSKLYFPSIVTNTILGGDYFRLFINLREKNGYTYGAYSSLNSDQNQGYFQVESDVKPEFTANAIAEIKNELDKITSEMPTAEELQRAKNYISGSFSISLEDPENLALFAIRTAIYKLKKSHYKNYLRRIERVKLEDLHSSAKEFIRKDNGYFLVVGSAKQSLHLIKKKFPDKKIILMDKNGNILPALRISPSKKSE